MGVHTVTVTVTDVRSASAQVTFMFTVNVPTAIGIASFAGAYANGAVVVQWTTTWEMATLGFHVYRGETDDFSQARRLTTTVIPSTGTGGSGYRVVDAHGPFLPARTFWYWVEEIAATGDSQRYWPVAVTIPQATPPKSPSTLYLPMVAR